VNLKLEVERQKANEKITEMSLLMKDYKFKFEDIREQFNILKSGEQIKG